MSTIAELSKAVGGTIKGAEDVEIKGVASLSGAGPTDIAPIESARYLRRASSSRAGAFVISQGLDLPNDRPCIAVADPRISLNRIIETLALVPNQVEPKIDPTARIDERARLGSALHIGPHSVVGQGAQLGDRCVLRARVFIDSGVVLGNDCVIEPGAVIYSGSVIGHRVRIGANAVIGGQGFGYAAGDNGPEQLYHLGKVVLEDDVQVGAGTTIDRARFDETRIGRSTKLDNLVHIAHNCVIGDRTFIAAQTGLAGEARIGHDCEIGGQVGISNRCGTGDRCRVGAKSGFFKMFGDDLTILGYPATKRFRFLRQQAALRRLADKVRKSKD